MYIFVPPVFWLAASSGGDRRRTRPQAGRCPSAESVDDFQVGLAAAAGADEAHADAVVGTFDAVVGDDPRGGGERGRARGRGARPSRKFRRVEMGWVMAGSPGSEWGREAFLAGMRTDHAGWTGRQVPGPPYLSIFVAKIPACTSRRRWRPVRSDLLRCRNASRGRERHGAIAKNQPASAGIAAGMG